MNHEIVGPEMTITTGQLRLPKAEAIARHIAQYTSFPGGEHVHDLVKNNETWQSHREAESERTRLSIDHNLMVHFLLAGNSEMALDTALHTEQLRSDHQELFDAMGKLVNQKLESGDRLWDGFHAVLKQIKPR